MNSDDPGAAESEASAGEPAPSTPHRYSYVTIRLTAAEFDQVARAARAAGQTVPGYGRDAVLGRAAADA